jgi:sugar O-acyltransferase (sialic acid O-acetyltransferase NeuD family)
MSKIVIVGGGGHAKVIIGVLKKNKDWSILGFTDSEDKGPILGARYLGNDDVLRDVIREEKECCAVIGVGYVRINDTREKLMEHTRGLGFAFPAIISQDSIVNEDVSFGEGTVVFDGALVNVGTSVGRCSIINTHSTVDHDCVIGNFAHVCPGAHLSGGVVVGNKVIIGTGASVVQYVNICDNCLIGAGTVVIKDIKEPGVYAGNPARLL